MDCIVDIVYIYICKKSDVIKGNSISVDNDSNNNSNNDNNNTKLKIC